MNDWQLLKQYAIANSEDAFRALVERYAGMVYHAALRQTGNPHTAKEIAQVVFIALAQKAKTVPPQSTLYGWLFRATRFAVLNQFRNNANRERREQEATLMQPATESNETDSVWERITPQLNDALDKLSATDREAVMIRFFGNKSHKDVADALGVSEETARKRISRALEKLRVIFARRGVVVASLTLTAAFAAHASQTAPMEAASSWAGVAMARAAAGTAATSTGGILALLAAAKIPVSIAALAGLAALGSFSVLNSVSHRSPAGSPATNLAVSLATNNISPIPVVRSQSAKTAGANPALAAALDKVKAALRDANPTTNYPNRVMQDAIVGLGSQKQAALPILEVALKDANDEVCLRAIDGLGIIGPEAGDAAPLLLDVLREGGMGQAAQANYTLSIMGNRPPRSFPIYANNMILYSLGQIHPAPEMLTQLVQLMKQNRVVLDLVDKADRQFPGNGHRPLQSGGWLWAMAGENSLNLNAAFVPLLRDPDQPVRLISALVLVSALGDQTDAAVFTVAAEMLKSDNNLLIRPGGLRLLTHAAYNLNSDNPPENPVLTAARLGSHFDEIVSALADAATKTKKDFVRSQAAKMLEALSPDFLKNNPELTAALESEDEANAFIKKVQAGEASLSEIREGLGKFPRTAPVIASIYARSGDSKGLELLPAFAGALAALDTKADRTKAINARQRLADAMQKIAPGRAKSIFTASDSIALTKIMNDPAVPGRSRSFPENFRRSRARRMARR